MAIRRCPYCKAIIEEGAEFCSNCGTQLLFPEDESIEEEIPGEKILDDDTDDEDIIPPEEVMDEGEFSEEISNLPDSEEVDKSPPKKLDTEQEDAPPEEESVQAEPEQEEESESLEDKEELKEDWSEIELEEEFVTEDEEDLPTGEELEGPSLEGESIEPKDIEPPSDEEVKPQDSRDEILQMEDLEKAVESDELEKQEIEKFIASIKKDRGEDIDLPPPPDSAEIEKLPSEEMEAPQADEDELPVEEPVLDEMPHEEEREEEQAPPSPGSSLFEKEEIKPPTDDMPPWAARIREEPPSSIPMEEEGEAEAREEPQPFESDKEPFHEETSGSARIPTLDTGMGLPEGVTQKDLPFKVELEERFQEEEKRERPKSPLRLSSWMKSRIFDVLFIAAVWLITVWITSYVMEVGLFRLISAAAVTLVLFYIILLVGYMFLFFFFLGETLGDHLFNPRHKSEPHPRA